MRMRNQPNPLPWRFRILHCDLNLSRGAVQQIFFCLRIPARTCPEKSFTEKSGTSPLACPKSILALCRARSRSLRFSNLIFCSQWRFLCSARALHGSKTKILSLQRIKGNFFFNFLDHFRDLLLPHFFRLSLQTGDLSL